MTVTEGYAIARKIKKKIKRSTDPEEICFRMGLEYVECDLANLKGMYSSANRHRTVYLNSRLVEYYERLQTVLHEVGHDQIPEHRLRARNSPLMDYTLRISKENAERDANVIMSHVLLNDGEVIDILKSGYTIEQAASKFNVHTDVLLLKLEEMHKLMGDRFPFEMARMPREASPLFLKG